MRGNEFLNKMELIDPAYTEAADAAPKSKRTIWTGWRAAVAACLCLVLLAGTAAAVSGSGIRLIDMFTGARSDAGYVESGYRLRAEVREFPVTELSDEVQAAGRQIAAQFENDPGENGPYPGLVRREFSSVDEAWKFIGLGTLKMPDWESVKWSEVQVWGNPDGEIEGLTVSLGYQVGDIELQADIYIYTEYFDREAGEIRFSVMDKEIEYAEDVYTTANGNLCQLVFSAVSEREDGPLAMGGHLVDDGVLYSLFVNYPEQDAAQAEELLHQWADMF